MVEITTGQAAQIAGVQRQTILGWIKSGKLLNMVRREKIGPFRSDHKIDKEKFEAWLQAVNSQ